MCGYFCIRFNDFILKGKILLDYTNLFFPNEYEKNVKIILKQLIFSIDFKKVKMTKVYCSLCDNNKKIKMIKVYSTNCKNYNEFKKPKISYIFEKTLVFSIICHKCSTKHKRIFKKEESTKTLKILGLI